MPLFICIPENDPFKAEIYMTARQIADVLGISERTMCRRGGSFTQSGYIILKKDINRDGRKNNKNPRYRQ